MEATEQFEQERAFAALPEDRPGWRTAASGLPTGAEYGQTMIFGAGGSA